MIEEAAGTRMYESKKQSAQRTIEKKDSKLQEIETVSLETLVTFYLDSHFLNCLKSYTLYFSAFSLFQILTEEITPTLTKLKEVRTITEVL